MLIMFVSYHQIFVVLKIQVHGSITSSLLHVSQILYSRPWQLREKKTKRIREHTSVGVEKLNQSGTTPTRPLPVRPTLLALREKYFAILLRVLDHRLVNSGAFNRKLSSGIEFSERKYMINQGKQFKGISAWHTSATAGPG